MYEAFLNHYGDTKLRYLSPILKDSVDFSKMFHVKQVAFRQRLSIDGSDVLILDINLSMERLDCI